MTLPRIEQPKNRYCVDCNELLTDQGDDLWLCDVCGEIFYLEED